VFDFGLLSDLFCTEFLVGDYHSILLLFFFLFKKKEVARGII
jgi:hypothetical protein